MLHEIARMPRSFVRDTAPLNRRGRWERGSLGLGAFVFFLKGGSFTSFSLSHYSTGLAYLDSFSAPNQVMHLIMTLTFVGGLIVGAVASAFGDAIPVTMQVRLSL